MSSHGFCSQLNAFEEWRWSWYKLPGPGSPEGSPEPDYIAYVFVFLGTMIICLLYKLTLSELYQVIVKLRVILSDLV